MLDYEVKAMLAWQRAKAAAMKGIREFLTDENGDTNMISIVVVLMIVLGLAAALERILRVLFRTYGIILLRIKGN